MRKLILLLAFAGYLVQADAQQDPMFTKYMFNSLAYNPAFAGSPNYMSVRLLYRNQWWAFEGAPETQSFTIHTPFKERVGLGLSVINDKIGATSSSSAFASYAYHVPFGNGNLSIGLQGGFINWRAEWDKLRFKDPQAIDNSFMENDPNRWMPNFGAGLFYYAPNFYVGMSVPRLLENDLNVNADDQTVKWARLYRHYFFHAGTTIPISGDMLIFKPSVLVKSVGMLSKFSSDPSDPSRVGAPAEFDIDLSVLFYQSLWLGVSFRSAFEAEQFGGRSSFDSMDIWASFYLQNGMRIGVAYDYTLTQIQQQGKGSFEIMVGYDMDYQVKKVTTPRYF